MTDHSNLESKLFILLIFWFEENNSFTLPSICLRQVGDRVFSLHNHNNVKKWFKESFDPYNQNIPWLAYEIDQVGKLIENGIIFDVRINQIYRLFPPFIHE